MTTDHDKLCCASDPGEVNQPVVSFVWNVQLGQLLQQNGVTHGTMSSALLKSRDITMTYGVVRKLLVMWWSEVIIVAIGDPVGLKAN